MISDGGGSQSPGRQVFKIPANMAGSRGVVYESRPDAECYIMSNRRVPISRRAWAVGLPLSASCADR